MHIFQAGPTLGALVASVKVLIGESSMAHARSLFVRKCRLFVGVWEMVYSKIHDITICI